MLNYNTAVQYIFKIEGIIIFNLKTLSNNSIIKEEAQVSEQVKVKGLMRRLHRDSVSDGSDGTNWLKATGRPELWPTSFSAE